MKFWVWSSGASLRNLLDEFRSITPRFQIHWSPHSNQWTESDFFRLGPFESHFELLQCFNENNMAVFHLHHMTYSLGLPTYIYMLIHILVDKSLDISDGHNSLRHTPYASLKYTRDILPCTYPLNISLYEFYILVQRWNLTMWNIRGVMAPKKAGDKVRENLKLNYKKIHEILRL